MLMILEKAIEATEKELFETGDDYFNSVLRYLKELSEYRERKDESFLLKRIRILEQAFEMACISLGFENCPEEQKDKCIFECAEHWRIHLIKKAREEYEDL